MTTLYLAKEPDAGVRNDLSHLSGDIVIVDCLNSYGEYYTKKGYNTLTGTELFDYSGMKFDIVIGNPPYGKRIEYKFLKAIPNLIDDNGYFDILLPSYCVGRSSGIDIFNSILKLESVDMTAGHHFGSIDGTWVARFRGVLGKTDSFDLTLPDGGILKDRNLSQLNSVSANFITEKKKGITTEDLTIMNKVLDSSIQYVSHKSEEISDEFYTYISPNVTRMTIRDKDPFPGVLTLCCVTDGIVPKGDKKGKKMNNGIYIKTDSIGDSERIRRIYGYSNLFVYLFYLAGSDSQYVNSFVHRLPDVTNITYKKETDLYEQFGLTEDEVKRVEDVMVTHL